MASFEDTLRYPMNSDDWIKTILIGGVLMLFSFLLIPAIAVYGYLINAVRDSLEGNPEPPVFTDWGELLRKGVFAWIIGLIYLLVPVIVGGVTIGGAAMAMATGSRSGAAAGFAGMLGGLGLTFLLSLVFGYFAVVALVNFARTDEFGAAFDFGIIRTVALDRDYFVPWLLSIVVFIVASVIAGVLNVVPFLGAIVGVFVFFYAEVVAAKLWGEGFAAAIEGDGHETTGVEEPAV